MKNKLSAVTTNLEQAMSIKYNTMVYNLQRQGKKILIMSLGEAFFDLPLFSFDDLPNPQIYHYSNSRGNYNLRKRLSEFFLKKYDIPINYEKEILLTAGSKAAIHFTFMSILNTGDEVLVPEPAWVSYSEQIKLCYAKSIQIPYYKNVFDYEKYITSRTKAIIVCNPHNPTGYIYNEQEVRHLLELSKKYNLWLLSDEAYSEFIDNDATFISPGKIDREKKHTIIFNSISKNYGISGWRLGYVIANEDVIFNILKVNQHIITCPPSILELYVDKYFYDIIRITEPQIKSLIEKRKIISRYMDSINIEYLKGSATFYFFVSISPSKLSSEEFCTKLLFEDYISTVPGLGYGDSCDNFIRISVGTATLEENKYALRKIKELIDKTTVRTIHDNKDVLVVAGGVWQKPLIKYLNKKGHIVTVVDPFLYSDGVKIADKHIQEDVRSVDKIWGKIKDIKYQFITTDQSDISVNTVAILSEKMHLDSNPYSVTNLFVNKYKMRNLAKKINIKIPVYSKIYSVHELTNFISKIGLPIIIKPPDSQSSRGVTKITINNVNLIEIFFIESLRYSNSEYILAEEFINGIEVTVEGFASGYKHRTFAVSKKKHFRTTIASTLEYPANIDPIIYKKIEKINDYYVEKSGLKFGITHAEYIINTKDKEPYLIEIACRGGGTLISSNITNWVSGVNIYDIFYDNLIGITTDVKSLKILKRNALLQFFEFKEGEVKNIIGIEEARKIKGVIKLELAFRIGDTLRNAEDDRSRHGFIIIFATTKQQLNNILNKVLNIIEIKYE